MATSISKLAILLTTDTSGMQAGFAQARANVRGFGNDLNGITAGFQRQRESSRNLAESLNLTSNGMSSMAMAGGLAAGLALGTRYVSVLSELTQWSIRLSEETKEATINFRVLMGDAAKADSMVSSLRKFALQSSFSQGDLQHNAQTMLAFGIASDKVIPSLRTLGDISMGNAEKMKLLTLAYSQTAAAGRLMGQDLLQMVNAGFNPLQEIARVTGMTMVDLKKYMEDGAVSAEMVATAFKTATEEGGRFNNAMLEQQNTLKGQFAMMKEGFGELIKPGGSVLGDLLMFELKMINSSLEWLSTGEMLTDEMKRQFAELGKPTQGHSEQLKKQAEEMKNQAGALKKAKEEAAKAAKAMEDMQRAGDTLTKSLRTPDEIFRDSLMESKRLLEANVISAETYNRSTSNLADNFRRANESAKEMKKSLVQTPTVAPLSRFSGQSQVAIQEARNRISDQAANNAAQQAHNLKQEDHNRKIEQMIEKILREVKESEPVILEEKGL